MNVPPYTPPTVFNPTQGIPAYLESLPEPPPTRLPWLRRLLWLGADHCGRHYRLSCLLHDIGWRMP